MVLDLQGVDCFEHDPVGHPLAGGEAAAVVLDYPDDQVGSENLGL